MDVKGDLIFLHLFVQFVLLLFSIHGISLGCEDALVHERALGVLEDQFLDDALEDLENLRMDGVEGHAIAEELLRPREGNAWQTSQVRGVVDRMHSFGPIRRRKMPETRRALT